MVSILRELRRPLGRVWTPLPNLRAVVTILPPMPPSGTISIGSRVPQLPSLGFQASTFFNKPLDLGNMMQEMSLRRGVVAFLSAIPCTTLVASAATAPAATNIPLPATLELDVIFPRNETYSPVTLFPVVFALQNPSLGGGFSLSVSWRIVNLSPDSETGYTFETDIYFPRQAKADTPLSFLTTGISRLNSTEGIFALIWFADVGTCKARPDGAEGENIYNGTDARGRIVFTLKKGSPLPNLWPFSGPQDSGCAQLDNATFGAIELRSVPRLSEFLGAPSCAVASPSQPTANPCAVQLNDTGIASLSSRITARACATPDPTLTSGCPPPTTETGKPSSAGGLAPNGRIVALMLFALSSVFL